MKAAKVCFWSPFAGAAVFIVAVAAGATKAAGHPILMFAVVGISTLIYAGGVAAGIAGLRRMKAEGRQGILARALIGVALNGVLLGLMLWLTGFLICDALRTARERERAAELEAQQLTARVGGGAALEKALVESANQNFALALQALQKNYDSAWAALTNPPVLDMALVKSQGDLRLRAEAVRRSIRAGRDLEEFTGKMPEIYQRELLRHKLSPAAREAGLQKFVDAIAAVSPTLTALRGAEVRQGEALLRVIRLLEETWGRWEYRPATRDLHFKEASQADDYNLAYQEFNEISDEAQSLREQLRTRNP
jgi:hypothetical protein